MRPLASTAVALLILALGPVHPSAHRTQHRDAPIACRLIALPGNSFTAVGIPDAGFRDFLSGPPTATFQVTYVGFGSFPAAQTAFQAAVEIWAHLIVSPVPIKVRAEFTSLPSNVLGSAGGQFLWRDFPGAPISGTWYVDSLADHVAGGDVNVGDPGAFDILASFNSSFTNWYFGTDGATPGGQYDFVSVALHELAHGLGYSGSASVSGLLGAIGFAGFPTIYDRFTVTETGMPLLTFPSPSEALGTQLTSGYNPANPRGPGSYWGGPQGSLGNSSLSARLYTPSTWTTGSSYSHLDEDTYPPGNLNSLMTFGIGQAEAIHDPGPVTLGMLDDSGWTVASPPAVPGPFSKTSPANGATNQPTTVSLTWGASTGATSYEYCIDVGVNFACDSNWISIGAATSTGVSGLSEGTTYEWQVRAQNLAGAAFADGLWFNFTTLTTPTRIIALSGGLGFGSTLIGKQPTRTLTLRNTGNSSLTVTGISYPAGFAGNWPGRMIPAGGAQDVIVTFSPTSATSYGGLVTVQADHTAGTPTITASGTGVTRLRTDLNGDGIGDLLLQDGPSTFVGAWLMSGAVGAASFVLVYPNNIQGWKVVGRADLNNDGVGDILLQNSDSTHVAAWYMNTTGQPATFVLVYPGHVAGWQVVGTADLNADGIADILLQDSVSTYVAAWLMNSAGQATSFVPVYFDYIYGWRVVATADVNSDGITDIVLQDSISTYVAAWIMNSAGQAVSFIPLYFGTTGTWRVVGSEDLNDDGLVDIVLQDTISTYVAAWIMNEAGPVSFTIFYPGSVAGWRVKGRR